MPHLNIQQILIRILVLTLSLSVHEYAHARTADRLGDDTAKAMGRLTLNPAHHIDVMGAIAFILLGFGWAKPVPVNPVKFSRDKVKDMRSGMMKVSLAGPVSNLIIAFIANLLLEISTLLYAVIGNGQAIQSANHPFSLWITILYAFYYSNIFLAIFNILPIPPLDGSKVLGAFLPNQAYYKYMSWQRYSGMILLAFFILGGGILSKIMTILAVPIDYILSKPVHLLFSYIGQSVI